jgi:hypothetical protein
MRQQTVRTVMFYNQRSIFMYKVRVLLADFSTIYRAVSYSKYISVFPDTKRRFSTVLWAAFQLGGLDLIPGQFIWYFWGTSRNLDRFFSKCLYFPIGRDSSVGIATGCVFNGPGIESR